MDYEGREIDVEEGGERNVTDGVGSYEEGGK